jgi:hypothetical protein
MKSVISIAVIVSSILYSCSPKSYCFFNVKEKTIYLTDNKKNDSIKSVTINSENPSLIFKRNFNVSPAAKSFRVNEDSIVNQKAYFLITTNNQVWYSLKLKEEDWSKDTVFKCRYLIR